LFEDGWDAGKLSESENF